MQLFAKGEYSGKVVHVSGHGDIEASVTTYQKTSFNSALHAHDNTHISFVLHGGCAEKKKDRYERLPGKLTFYYAGEPHQVTSVAERSRHINIEIGSRFFRDNQLAEDDLFLAMKENPDAKFLMLGIYRELLASDTYSPLYVRMLLLDLAKKSGQLLSFGERPRWVTLVKEYLQAHWNEVITLHELAVHANLHPVTISKYFPRYFGCTFGEYMRKLKIDTALSLVKSGEESLTSVAYECGFADQSHFIRIFKQLTGFSPAMYQKA